MEPADLLCCFVANATGPSLGPDVSTPHPVFIEVTVLGSLHIWFPFVTFSQNKNSILLWRFVYLSGFYDCLMIACGEFKVCEGWKHNIGSMDWGIYGIRTGKQKWNIHFSATINLSMLYVGRLWWALCDKMVSNNLLSN